MIKEILFPVLVMGGLSILLGVLILITMKVFEVKRDPAVDEILSVLPGVNCGACGFPGCENFAVEMAKKGELYKICPVGKDEVANKIREILKKKKEGVSNG
ncbi:MAG: (Fe-S)-binding protein [candidate division WOR-3 bacterium]|jgi:RnfABCDGE-type electron transport complex B subunit